MEHWIIVVIIHKTRYISILSTAFLVVVLAECVRSRPYPVAPRSPPVPPTIGSSLTVSKMTSLESTATELPLWLPAVNTKLAVSSSAYSVIDANWKKPCALPTAGDAASGPSVSRSSMTYMSPKWVVGSLASGTTPLMTCTAVAGVDGPPVMMSCM
ncbi:hypothetical protein VPH35_026090 [Triticum aestivum]